MRVWLVSTTPGSGWGLWKTAATRCSRSRCGLFGERGIFGAPEVLAEAMRWVEEMEHAVPDEITEFWREAFYRDAEVRGDMLDPDDGMTGLLISMLRRGDANGVVAADGT